MVCPVIDVISDDTFEYHYRDSTGVNVGGFDWNLQVWFRFTPTNPPARLEHKYMGINFNGGTRVLCRALPLLSSLCTLIFRR